MTILEVKDDMVILTYQKYKELQESIERAQERAEVAQDKLEAYMIENTAIFMTLKVGKNVTVRVLDLDEIPQMAKVFDNAGYTLTKKP